MTDFCGLVFEPRNPDLIDQFIAPDFGAQPDAHQAGLHVAEGDLVTFVFQQNGRFSFDLFRIKNGKIVEHWDSATR